MVIFTRVHSLARQALVTTSLSAVAVSLAGAGAAHAQVQNTTSNEVSLEVKEIIVTARKQTESLQDIPVAISVLSEEEIANSRLYDSSRLGEMVPGVTSGGSQQRGGLVIRGITTRTPEVGADSVVGQYIDEVYQPRITSQFSALLDLKRIEVLKGPQGTLYGRNTIGGVVNYITNKPSQAFDAYMTLGAGTRDSYEWRAGVSGPLAPTLAAGISAMARGSDGNIDVYEASGSKIGDDGSNDVGVRMAVNWNPTERLEINASAFTLRMRGASLDMIAGLPAGVIGPILAGFGVPPSIYMDDNKNYRIFRTTAGHLNRDTTEFALRADLKLNDAITLTSLTAYQKYKMRLVNDFDYDVQPLEMFRTDEDSDTISQELRLAGVMDSLKWTVGVNYFHDDLDHREMDDFTGGIVELLVPPPFPVSTNRVKTTSAAVFGQANYALTDQLTLTGGIRYSYDKRKYHKINANQFPGFDNFDSADPATYPGIDWDTSPHWDNVSYLVSADYNITPDMMIYASHSTGYRSGGIQGRSGSAAQASANYDPEHARQFEVGFKSKLFDKRVVLNVAAYHIKYRDAQINQIPLNSPFDIITNAAGAVFKGIEVESEIVLTQSLSLHLGYTYNDSHFTKFRDAEDIPGLISSLDFDNDGLPDCPGPSYGCAVQDHIYDGVPFEFASKHSFLAGVDYQTSLSDTMALDIHAEYSWKAAHLLTPLPQSIAARSNSFLNANYLRQPAYGLLSASASLRFGGNWSIGIWGRNLTDKQYLTQGGDPQPAVDGYPFNTFLTGDRRTIGFTLNWRY